MSEIKFEKHERLKTFLKLLLAILLLIISTYAISAVKAANGRINSLVNTMYYSEDKTKVYFFRDDTIGTYYTYTYDENNEVSDEDRFAFTYQVEDRAVNVTFINDLDPIEFKIIKNALLDFNNNNYYFLLN